MKQKRFIVARSKKNPIISKSEIMLPADQVGTVIPTKNDLELFHWWSRQPHRQLVEGQRTDIILEYAICRPADYD